MTAKTATEAAVHPLSLATRMSRLGTETAFEVLVRARALEAQGKHVVHLEIGEPDFDTPANVIEAGVEALQSGWTHYSPSAGLPELRSAIAEYISRTRQIDAKPEEVVVVPGGKPVMSYVISALVNEGDEVIYPNPGFPIYESMVNFVGARPVPVQIRESRDFSLDVDELAGKITGRTKLIILNSPHNPTGGTMSIAEVQALGEAIGEREIFVLSDEIYSRLIYEGQHHSLASVEGFRDRVIILDGFSKTYAMTGWRLGYGVMRADLASAVARLAINYNSCTASFTQIAGVEALRGDQSSVEKMKREFQRRRDRMVSRLNTIPGFSCKLPKGAFYVFPNITGTGWRSKELASALLEDAGVACLAGTAFGQFGEGYIRMSVANSIENIELALDRIEQWAREHSKN